MSEANAAVIAGMKASPTPIPRTTVVPRSQAIGVCAPIKPNGIVARVVTMTPTRAIGPPPYAVGEPSDERHHEHHPEPHRRHQEAGVEGALGPDFLPVERDQDHPAEEGGAEAEHRDRRGREGRAPVEVEVEERARDPQRVHGEDGDQDERRR